MSEEVLVKVDNVSKRFCRSLKRSLWYGLQDLGSEIGGRRHGGGSGLPQSSADVKLRPDEFWAVKDVSFELRRGECLGLIGRNGAGKTTLLRMLNGLIKPDTGRIEMRGEVAALVALGAGFNPLLTGRENIYNNASILGIPDSTTKDLIGEIIDFAEIHDFIDSPVQLYSSGMAVRLGIAIAFTLKPDILILDEVLAVGDWKFKSKCYQKIGSIISDCAVIVVTHNEAQLARIATLGLMLEKGAVKCSGPTAYILSKYINSSLIACPDKANTGILSSALDCRPRFNLSNKEIEHGGSALLTITGLNLPTNATLVLQHERDGELVAVSEIMLPEMHPNNQDIYCKIGPVNLIAGQYVVHVIIDRNDNGVQIHQQLGICAYSVMGKKWIHFDQAAKTSIPLSLMENSNIPVDENASAAS
jgi:ABC-type polysaccharide/polyol phosphate transport system ATPase subunit